MNYPYISGPKQARQCTWYNRKTHHPNVNYRSKGDKQKKGKIRGYILPYYECLLNDRTLIHDTSRDDRYVLTLQPRSEKNNCEHVYPQTMCHNVEL